MCAGATNALCSFIVGRLSQYTGRPALLSFGNVSYVASYRVLSVLTRLLFKSFIPWVSHIVGCDVWYLSLPLPTSDNVHDVGENRYWCRWTWFVLLEYFALISCLLQLHHLSFTLTSASMTFCLYLPVACQPTVHSRVMLVLHLHRKIIVQLTERLNIIHIGPLPIFVADTCTTLVSKPKLESKTKQKKIERVSEHTECLPNWEEDKVSWNYPEDSTVVPRLS